MKAPLWFEKGKRITVSSNSNNCLYCPLPWNHLSIEPDGRVFTCCNASSFSPLGNSNDVSLDKIWESPELQAIRNEMLNGKIPKQCQVCVDEEKRGGISLRKASLARYPEVKTDNPFPTYLGIRFDNLCNLNCRICSPSFSTAWNTDFEKLSRNYSKGVIKAFSADTLFELENSPLENLETLYLAGGEPFLSTDILNVLKKLDPQKVEIIINTNGSIPYENNQVFSFLSHFKNLSLDLSLDSTASSFEYARNQGSWTLVKDNMAFIRKHYPHVQLKIFPTVSIFNLFKLKDLFIWAFENQFLPEDIRLNALLDPHIFALNGLPEKYKKEGLLEVMSLIESYKDHLGLVAQLKSLIPLLQSKDPYSVQTLKEIEIIDKIRNQDFFKVYLEYSREFFTGK